MTQRFRGWLIGAVLVVVGVLVGYALPQSSVSPKSEAGTVTKVTGPIGGNGAKLAFKIKGQTGTVKYPMQDPLPWQGTKNGTWHHSGQPSCLVPGSTKPVKATLGVISVHADGSAPGGSMIVWVECYN
ncbi:MAG TPA: hypothetical protein VMA95_21665 [Streptosporangiaceae bacterium]|nr:hypothetical protein [Streptosporangiaceae bacterium]